MTQGNPTPNRRPDPDEAVRRDANEKSGAKPGGHDTPCRDAQEKAPHPQDERSGPGGPSRAPNIDKDDPRTQRGEPDPKHRPSPRG